jgi:adenine-specific DNA methylase
VIPKECKRLAEVDFPIAQVSRHAVREKSIRHGHPSTLHMWWARRPLASSRAVLLALLLPDPCDPLCPTSFKAEARKLLPEVGGCNPGVTDKDLQKALLKFIGNFANWDAAASRIYLKVGRGLVKAANGDDAPLVVDPFAGGGSIPLEALRLGCDTFASDLNPVACLILKVMLELIPRNGPKLAEEVRLVGEEIQRQAKEELSDLYPNDPDGSTPIAYIWARTVHCEAPNCGAEIPLVRSFWLCKKASRKRALRLRVLRPTEGAPYIEFDVFKPESEDEVPKGTVSRAKATCAACRAVLPPPRVRAQLAAQRGGAEVVFDGAGQRTGGARMLAVVTLRPGQQGREYRLPVDDDYRSVRLARQRLSAVLSDWETHGKQGFCPIPDEPLKRVPVTFGVINVWVYGMEVWSDLFSSRQSLALLTLDRLVAEQPDPRIHALALDRLADYSSSLCRWVPNGEFIGNTFGRPALPMIWDFCEVNPFSSATGGYPGALEWVANVMDASPISRVGQVESASATSSPLPDASAAVWFTDPPYYDSVPYSYISDFFFVWLKRMLGTADPEVFGQALSPKREEIVAYLSEGGDAKEAYRTYEERMATAFAAGRRVLEDSGIGCVVFAHKTTEGWEALLSGLIQGGWTITGSWPVATEMGARLRARDSATLSTSVHLVCRPRPDDAGIGDWAEVLRELPRRVGDWMERLQGESVRGADLVFACIGPALEIFSRYSRVESADGREIALAEYLEKVWEVVGRSALAQVLGTAEARARNGAAGAVEEDARLTALFLWTLQSTNGDADERASAEDAQPSEEDEDEEGSPRGKAKGFTLVFDVVRRFAQPLGIDLPEWEGRIIETKKGTVRLLPITERAKQLFGDDGAHAVAARLEREAATGGNPFQGTLFPEMDVAPRIRGSGRGRARRASAVVADEDLAAGHEATTLDRVHAAMLLQAGGRTNALRALLKAEQERGSDFVRLANALSALYPKDSEEKRLLDAMLLAVPR